MKSTTKLKPTVIKRQRARLWDFLQRNSGKFCLQINFNVPGTPDHVCIGVPHKEATKFAELIFNHLVPEEEQKPQK